MITSLSDDVAGDGDEHDIGAAAAAADGDGDVARAWEGMTYTRTGSITAFACFASRSALRALV